VSDETGWSASVVEALTGVLGEPPATDDTFGPLAIDLPADRWVETARRLRDDCGATYLDWLSAVDELSDGFRVVVHLARLGQPVEHVCLRTLLPRTRPVLDSLVPVYAGAGWHERETHEMFGVEFTGGVAMDILLLPEDFEGHPLRKDFVLASRVAQPWPGAKEPGESDSSHAQSAPARRTMRPPGVPEPAVWGPRAPGSPAPDPLAAAVPTAPTRPRRERRTAEAAPPAPPAASPDPGPSPTDGGDG